MKNIFLFGHRQQHGKDTCCNFLEKMFSESNKPYARTYFSKMLKRHVAEKYNLDFAKMEDNTYKSWCPPHLNKKFVLTSDGMAPVDRTVRDILIEEGCKSREIWTDVWANAVYMELYRSAGVVGIVSDYRYPNEYSAHTASFNEYLKENIFAQKANVVRVLVHRPDGIFKNDGADGELPDIDEKVWDFIIMNDKKENWENNLKNQLKDLLTKYGV